MIDLNGAATHAADSPRLGRAAMLYATKIGLAVFPCMPRNKPPLDLCDKCMARLPGYAPQADHKSCRECGTVYEKNRPRGFHIATREVAKIERWWNSVPDANIGLPTGSGLLVLDIDGEEGEKSLTALVAHHGPLPPTPEQITGKGRHLFFSVPSAVKCSSSHLGENLDIRADGGYVAVAPSMHPNGKRYRFVEGRNLSDLPRAPAPEWLLAKLVKPKAKEPNSTTSQRPDIGSIPDAYVRRAVDGEYERVATTANGRNTALNQSAFSLGQLVGAGALPIDIARQTLEGAAATCGVLAEECHKTLDTIARGLAAGMAQPRDLSEIGRARQERQERQAERRGPRPHDGNEAREDQPQSDAPQGHGFRGEWLKDIVYHAEPELVEGLLPSTGLGFLYGPSSAGKSFIAIDWGLCLASGRQVLARPTLPSGVLYIAAEGQAGLRKRLVAARRQRELDDVELPFNYLPAFINLADPRGEEVERVLAFARERSDEMQLLGAPLRLIIIDTMAAAAPGVDENAGKDMGPLIFRLQKLAADLGCLVLVVAHVGKDEARGLRGWSGSRAAADVAIECRVERDHNKLRESPVTRRHVWFEKAKDGPCGFTLADYHLRSIEVGKKQSGQPDTTCWVEYATPPPPPTRSSVADTIEAQTRERARAAAFTEQMLEAIVGHLTDNWTASSVTADRLKTQASLTLGREKLVRRLRVMASDEHQGLVTIDRPGAQIQILTIRPTERANAIVNFRVIKKTASRDGEVSDAGCDAEIDARNDDELGNGAEHGR